MRTGELPRSKTMQDLNEICKAIAEVLPWEIQSALLSIRDDGLRPDEIPSPMFDYMKELSYPAGKIPDTIKRMRTKKITAMNYTTEFITPKSKLKMIELQEEIVKDRKIIYDLMLIRNIRKSI